MNIASTDKIKPKIQAAIISNSIVLFLLCWWCHHNVGGGKDPDDGECRDYFKEREDYLFHLWWFWRLTSGSLLALAPAFLSSRPRPPRYLWFCVWFWVVVCKVVTYRAQSKRTSAFAEAVLFCDLFIKTFPNIGVIKRYMCCRAWQKIAKGKVGSRLVSPLSDNSDWVYLSSFYRVKCICIHTM